MLPPSIEVFCSYNMLVQEIIVFVNRFTWCSTVYSQVSNSVYISISSTSKLAVQTDIISFLNSFFLLQMLQAAVVRELA